MAVADQVTCLVAAQLGVDELCVTFAASFADLGADSLDGAALVLALEDTFGLEIPDADAAQLTSVGAVVDYLEAHATHVPPQA